MMAVLLKFSMLALTIVCLAGCCGNVTTDPREGGLAGGVCGTATGAYDQRIATLEISATSLQDANARLESRLASASSETSRLDRDIAAKRGQLAAIQVDLERLQQLSGERDTLRTEIAALKEEAGRREARIMAIERGIRSATDERIRDDARRQAEDIPVDDLLKRLRSLSAAAN